MTQAELIAAGEQAAARAGRSCGDCDLCCHALRVGSIGKAAYSPCPHAGAGCTIHDVRPDACRAFFCAWRFGVGSEHERPDRTGFLIAPPNTETFTWRIYPAKDRPFEPDAWPAMFEEMQARNERLGMPFAFEVIDPERGSSMVHATDEWMRTYRRYRPALPEVTT